MSIIACPKCGDHYAAYLFDFGLPFRCRCGLLVSPPVPEGKKAPRSLRRPVLPRPAREDSVPEEARIGALKRWADRICFLIVASDIADYEIEMEKRALRRWCGSQFPDRMDLYDRVFEARFQRLWQQFRKGRK
jgi:hypothetical protein